MNNIMEATLRKGLEPVNALEDKANHCLSEASLIKARGECYRFLVFSSSELDNILLSMSIVRRILWKSPWNTSDWNSILQIHYTRLHCHQ